MVNEQGVESASATAADHAASLNAQLKALADTVAAGLPGAIETSLIAFDELTLTVARDKWIEALTLLRDACGFVSFIDLTGVDWPAREERFDVVVHLLAPKANLRVRVKTRTDEARPVPSASDLWPAVDWYEREAYDMYGVLFTGHPDLRRILTDYGFDGHPLRKDFPTSGYVEVRYDDEQKRVVYEPVRLTQEYRSFDFLSPWEGTDYVLPGDEKANKQG